MRQIKIRVFYRKKSRKKARWIVQHVAKFSPLICMDTEVGVSWQRVSRYFELNCLLTSKSGWAWPLNISRLIIVIHQKWLVRTAYCSTYSILADNCQGEYNLLKRSVCLWWYSLNYLLRLTEFGKKDRVIGQLGN